jgi:hypothetical protein
VFSDIGLPLPFVPCESHTCIIHIVIHIANHCFRDRRKPERRPGTSRADNRNGANRV